jgi:hypothetical protein
MTGWLQEIAAWVKYRRKIMPAKAMLQFECARCGRNWLVPSVEGSEPQQPSLQLEFGDGKDAPLKVEYDVLCGSCFEALKGYATAISKPGRAAALRGRPKAKKKEEVVQPPPPPPSAVKR